MESFKLVKKSNKTAEHLIIFVHGFTGGKKTFVNKNQHFCSFFDTMILDACDIYEFRYYSSILDFLPMKKALSLIGLGKAFGTRYNVDLCKYSELLDTHYCNSSSKYRSINIISHSMGGLIAKRFIIESFKKRNCYTGFYISLSTPHRGVSEAKLLSLLNNPFINSMEPFSTFIDETSNGWAQIASGIKRKYYCATHDEIVNDRSACPSDDTKYLVRVEGSHTTIVKPSSKDCALIKNINSAIVNFLGLDPNPVIPIRRKLSAADVLFYAYKKELEPYYLARNPDNEIADLLRCNNLWIYGASGTGKTNSIQRFLLHNNHRFFSFDMSPNSPDCSSSDILANIYWSFRSQLQFKYDLPKQADGTRSWIECICELLTIIAISDQIYLFIDELHINDPLVFDKFIDDTTTLISFYNNKCGSLGNVKLIISTIKSPLSCDTLRFKEKFSALFSAYVLNYWEKGESMTLLEIICKALKLNLSQTDILKILESTKGSPRRLKVIIKKAINFKSVDKAILELNSEGVF